MPKLSIFNHSIVTKLICVLCVIFVLGTGITVTDIYSLLHVKNSLISMVKKDVVQIINNGHTIGELYRIFSQANILIETFTQRNQIFNDEKNLVLNDLKKASAHIKKKDIQSSIDKYYLNLQSAFTCCMEINTLLSELNQINNNLMHNLVILENMLIEQKSMHPMHHSVEYIALEQFHSIVSGHRDVFYEIHLLVTESRQMLMSFQKRNKDVKRDVLNLLQEFQMGFQAITTAWEDVHQLNEKILKQSFKYKSTIIVLFQKMADLQTKYIALTKSQQSMMIVFHLLNDEISKKSNEIGENISIKVDATLNISIVIYCIITSCLIFLCIYIVQMVRPLRHLYYGAQRIGAGDLDYHLEIKTKDEIGQLADAFNQMTMNLQKSMVSISKYKQAEQELKNTQAQLIQSGKLASIGELSAGICHELNQPLMVIRLNAQYYLKKHQSQNEEAELWHTVQKNTSRMMKIIDHLRTFSRQSKKEFAPVNVHDILQDCFLMIGQQFQIRGIDVITILNADYSRINGDANQLEQVFLNLLTNARDAMEKKGQIQITTQQHSDCIEIVFTDTGRGIPNENVNSIFDPFFTTKEVGKGTGLGLSISYGIIKDHSGTIEIAETGPSGTSFKITLPLFYGK